MSETTNQGIDQVYAFINSKLLNPDGLDRNDLNEMRMTKEEIENNRRALELWTFMRN